LFLLLPLRFRFLQHVQEQKANDARKTLSRTVAKKKNAGTTGDGVEDGEAIPFRTLLPAVIWLLLLANQAASPRMSFRLS